MKGWGATHAAGWLLHSCCQPYKRPGPGTSLAAKPHKHSTRERCRFLPLQCFCERRCMLHHIAMQRSAGTVCHNSQAMELVSREWCWGAAADWQCAIDICDGKHETVPTCSRRFGSEMMPVKF
jgi:hypothetical protein